MTMRTSQHACPHDGRRRRPAPVSRTADRASRAEGRPRRDSRRTTLAPLVLLALPALLLPPLSGCKKGPEFAEVTGTVKIDGVPTGGIQVSFEPQSQDPRVILPAAYGMTSDDGTYKLLRRGKEPGAPVGLHHVRMVPIERDEGKSAVIHPRYQANNALWADVQPGKNVIDFDLISGKKPPPKPAAEQ